MAAVLGPSNIVINILREKSSQNIVRAKSARIFEQRERIPSPFF
jgi:hypothetical protein